MRNRAVGPESSGIAVVLGVGAGWELKLLRTIGFAQVIGYEPAQKMLAQAKETLAREHLDGVELHGRATFNRMLIEWRGRANLVLATHVIPALSTRDLLDSHFKQSHQLLRVKGTLLCITNNPETQFLDHPTYSGHHFGSTVKDGDKIFTTIKATTIGSQNAQTVPLVSGKSFIVEDTFWSEPAIRESMRIAGFRLIATHYINLIKSHGLAAPYVAYECSKQPAREANVVIG